MTMVRIKYNQMEQLVEYRLRSQISVTELVAEALSHWLEFIAPGKHGATCITPLRLLSKEHLSYPCNSADPEGNTEAR